MDGEAVDFYRDGDFNRISFVFIRSPFSKQSTLDVIQYELVCTFKMRLFRNLTNSNPALTNKSVITHALF